MEGKAFKNQVTVQNDCEQMQLSCFVYVTLWQIIIPMFSFKKQ